MHQLLRLVTEKTSSKLPMYLMVGLLYGAYTSDYIKWRDKEKKKVKRLKPIKHIIDIR